MYINQSKVLKADSCNNIDVVCVCVCIYVYGLTVAPINCQFQHEVIQQYFASIAAVF